MTRRLFRLSLASVLAGGGVFLNQQVGFAKEQKRIIVTYNGKTYDVTDFCSIHPGGEGLLKGADGMDLKKFFDVYTIHKNNQLVDDYLTGMEINSTDSMKSQNQLTLSEGNARTWMWRRLRVLAVLLVAPLLWIRKLLFSESSQNRPQKVAVIGGGIAGCGAAYSLSKAGFETHIFESRAALGGNATTWDWETATGPITTGLAVLAWPTHYFRNYTSLLKELNIATERVELPYFINSTVEGYEGYLNQLSPEESLGTTFKTDLQRWDSAVSTATKLNELFCGGGDRSMYKSSYINPMNFVSLKTLLKLHGCSDAFWDVIVVSQYGSSFLTPHLDTIPATILPIINDLIPLTEVPGVVEEKAMTSWAKDSREVFKKMTSRCTVNTNARVHRVTPNSIDDDGNNKIKLQTMNGDTQYFDRIVMACNAGAAGTILQNKPWYERALLDGVQYTDDLDTCWVAAHMHSDPSVLRESHRQSILDKCATYIDVSGSLKDGYEYDQTFVLGSWYPAAQRLPERKNGGVLPFLVSHGEAISNRISPDLHKGTVSHVRAHPVLSPFNLLISQLLPLLQGSRGIHYCGSYSTPGNGHDLSLLSGFVAANGVGAEYPFPENESARRDFDLLKRLM
eukprot:TRINITY_DN4511_c0_g1_i1.p1 TRINITY_DN4511_c0_g1~~TRINITY_DN4511_c0_g1_i1.p1  ORF type:complete len:623 (+),score=128.85 TRINITY_DN4511_c0_g1_i1:50-1918(+)